MLKKIFSSGLGWLWLTAIVIACDQYAKLWALQHLEMYQPRYVLSFFNLTLAYNTGAAFSFLHSASGWQNWLFGGFAVVVSVMVLSWLSRLSVKQYWLSTALCLILAGAIGNAWDRVQYGYVVDFLDFHWGTWHFAIFNIADMGVSIGAFMLFCAWVSKRPLSI